MPTFSNVHAELENSELHPPRDFSLAENDTTLSKNPLGNLQWLDTYWQRPVLGFADATFPPFTLQHGDRYIIFGNTSLGSTAIDTSVDTSLDTSVWIDTSVDSSGEVFPPIVDDNVHPTWGDVSIGDIVEYYQTDSNGQPVFEWRAVTPQSGYQVFNLADRSTYYFSGSEWKKQVSASALPVAPQLSITYAELALLVDSEQLVPGVQYWISDREIIVTATSKASLSIEADHTRFIKAYGQIKLLTGTAGSIDAVLIDGVNLIDSSVAFNTDLPSTATDLVDAINSNTATHGYSAFDIGTSVYVIDVANRGASINGLGVTVSATGITTATLPLARGVDSGVNWFKIKYDFSNDYIFEMLDNKGNKVSCNQQVASLLGVHPIEIFPWGYDNVYNNQVVDSLLVCFPNEAVVTNNKLEGKAFAVFSFQTGDSFTGNTIANQTFCRLVTSGGCSINGNEFVLSNVDLELLGGTIVGNRVLASTMLGSSITLGAISLNYFSAAIFSLQNAVVIAMLKNRIDDGEYNFEGATFELRKNTLKNTDVDANGASVLLSDNNTDSCTIDVSDAVSSFEFSRNHVRYNTTISLQRAQGLFTDNDIEHLELTGNDSHTSFQRNKLSNNCVLTLTNFTGSQFFGNSIAASTIDLLDSSGEFNWNKINNSTVQMQRHTGDCNQNVFAVAEITSNDSGSSIDNNYIDQSNVLLSNTNGDFSGNKATFYSNFNLDGYLGARVTINKLDSGSSFTANGNTAIHGGVIVEEATVLDISYQNSVLYDCYFKLPTRTIQLAETQISKRYDTYMSTLESSVTIDSSGVIDLGSMDAAFSGVIFVSNTATLEEIVSMSNLPSSLILRPQSGTTLTISGTSTSIKFASGIVNLPVNGANGGFVVLRKGIPMVVTELFAG